MSRDAEVCDAVRIDRDLRPDRRELAATAEVSSQLRKPPPRRPEKPASLVGDLADSLSLFVPGLSQIVRGNHTAGLFYLSWMAFLGALVAAVLGTLDRLVPTLELLDRSPAWISWVLGGVFCLAATLHMTAVWNVREAGRRSGRHPAIPTVASLIVPGWGQLLNGDRLRCMLFLGGCWIVAGAWILSSDWATDLFNTYVPVVAPWEQPARAPLVLWTLRWTAPVVIWTLAVYDAASRAVARRRLS
jgi:hypothetical protein